MAILHRLHAPQVLPESMHIASVMTIPSTPSSIPRSPSPISADVSQFSSLFKLFKASCKAKGNPVTFSRQGLTPQDTGSPGGIGSSTAVTLTLDSVVWQHHRTRNVAIQGSSELKERADTVVSLASSTTSSIIGPFTSGSITTASDILQQRIDRHREPWRRRIEIPTQGVQDSTSLVLSTSPLSNAHAGGRERFATSPSSLAPIIETKRHSYSTISTEASSSSGNPRMSEELSDSRAQLGLGRVRTRTSIDQASVADSMLLEGRTTPTSIISSRVGNRANVARPGTSPESGGPSSRVRSMTVEEVKRDVEALNAKLREQQEQRARESRILGLASFALSTTRHPSR